MLIRIDPPNSVSASFARMIRNPFYERAAGIRIVRKGNFLTARGIHGFERVSKLLNPTGKIETFCWFVDGKFLDAHVLNVQITTVENDWLNGSIWADLLDSINVVGGGVSLPEKVAGQTPFVGQIGVLRELPGELHYLADIAARFAASSDEEVENNSEAFDLLDARLKQETYGLSKESARARIKSDEVALSKWLAQHSSDMSPETKGLYAVLGALNFIGENL